MTYQRFANSLRRLEYEYNLLTNYGNITHINHSFNIHNVNIHLQHSYDNERAIVINKLQFVVKRKTNKKMNQHLLKQLVLEDISHKINEYLNDFDVLSFEIHIEYDPLYYPLRPPLWKLVSLSNKGFISDTENAVNSLVHLHNDVLEYDWSCAISLSSDINYFVSKFMKLMGYI